MGAPKVREQLPNRNSRDLNSYRECPLITASCKENAINASLKHTLRTPSSLREAVDFACESIAPSWPLDRMIAVSPYWNYLDQPFRRVGKTLFEIASSRMSMPLSYYQKQWKAGNILPEHLAQAVKEMAPKFSTAQMVAAFDETQPPCVPAPLLSDSVDLGRDTIHEPAWCDTITHQIAQFCAAFFDEAQADWHPKRDQPLYESWRSALARDHSVTLLMRSPDIASQARNLAEEPLEQIEKALTELRVKPADWCRFLHVVIHRVSGWAAWCAYLRWQARLTGGDDRTLLDLLAIRLSWECLIDDGQREPGSVWQSWQTAWEKHLSNTDEQALEVHFVWQRAQEISYQQHLCRQLTAPVLPQDRVSPKVQAAFCIDTRSEVFRRHLEAQSPHIQTLGFAGFFGLPVSYTPIGTQACRPQLPGLLSPAIALTDSTGDATSDQEIIRERHSILKKIYGWRPFKTVPASAFTLVETLGLGYAMTLLKRSLPQPAALASKDFLGLKTKQVQALQPNISIAMANDVTAQSKIAAQILTGMNLTTGFATLVVLIGHGSQTRNNPQRAGLNCGACCGQTGEVNARALAVLLNDVAVREALKSQGISIPEQTVFIAGLHNTTTDEVRLFDTAALNPTQQQAVVEFENQLRLAGLAVRQERAPLLGLSALVNKPAKLTQAIRQRANDWAQTRPEWGLANNAAFIVAPRGRTELVNLAGRSFLHEYDSNNDPHGTVLESIMTAPMIVTHWINMQYFASTVDNLRFGSGNKTLHNVVGGRLGVFEGNGGDLRIGLAWQSVHDGEDWRHQPIRLTVVIDAPQLSIEKVIAKHAMVKNLVDNQWLYLARFNNEKIDFYRDGKWSSLSL